MPNAGAPVNGSPRVWFDDVLSIDVQTAADAALLSSQLPGMRQRLFSPVDDKSLRRFSCGEAARLIGVSDGYLRQLSLSGEGPEPSHVSRTGRRAYTLEVVNEMRAYLASQSGAKAGQYIRHRNAQAGEQLQIIAVTNFKCRSGKTTTATHLAQHMALQGYRVLAIDLDPQASMSALLGYQPDVDHYSTASIYDAVRYDCERVPLGSVILNTYFPGLDLAPASFELQEFEHATPRSLAMRDSGSPEAYEGLFLARIKTVIAMVADRYDVVILDCPPQLGVLTLSALYAATAVIVTVNPQMPDVASTSRFLRMTSDLLSEIPVACGELNGKLLRYLITQYEPNDGLQTQVAALLRAQFAERVLTAPMIKSPVISDAGLSKQTLYDVGREGFPRGAYDRAMESLTAVNSEIEGLVKAAWGRADR
ncbi:plasmid partitioning protein RepA [Ensifer sp. LC54]|nr:plasmid partitioning protein RepA [Ensifer sp. LC384]OCP24325.1 plasmid partitioning protein RepA [Ensifer sp. LC54]